MLGREILRWTAGDGRSIIEQYVELFCSAGHWYRQMINFFQAHSMPCVTHQVSHDYLANIYFRIVSNSIGSL